MDFCRNSFKKLPRTFSLIQTSVKSAHLAMKKASNGVALSFGQSELCSTNLFTDNLLCIGCLPFILIVGDGKYFTFRLEQEVLKS